MGVVSTLIVGEASAVANGTHSKSVIERAIGLIVLQRRRIFHLTGGQIFSTVSEFVAQHKTVER